MEKKKKLDHVMLGCIADDFTGASDAASFLANQGIKTLLFNGVPKDTTLMRDCAAIVIAMKTRNIPADEAVRDTLEAFRWLKAQGVEQYYIKYCSTFDSTPKGNIGPDIDAVMEAGGVHYTLLCPSLPVNRRIVRNGTLIVDGKPIAEGHMAQHPLNPIWASSIPELMKPQGKYPCMILEKELLEKNKEEILDEVEKFGEKWEHFYIVPDYETDEQGKKIVEVFGQNPLLTGGSGILEHMAENYKNQYDCSGGETLPSWTPGNGIALSGSCSTATCVQCKNYEAENPAKIVYPSKLLSGAESVETLWKMAEEDPKREVLFYSAGATDPDSRVYKNEKEAEKASAILEKTMAEIGKKAYDAGYTRIISAGGETSSALALALGFDAFIIGESIAPGVPIMIPLHHQNIRIALKSGNFGQPDFFKKAFDMTRKKQE